MKTRSILVLAALALAPACAPADPKAGDRPDQASDRTADGISATQTLFGQWRVVSVDGEDPGAEPMYLLFGEDWWHMQSQCIYASGDYQGTVGAIDFSPIGRSFPDLQDGPILPEAMCARGLTPAESAIGEAMTGSGVWKMEGDRLTIRTATGTVMAVPSEEPAMTMTGSASDDPGFVWGEWQVAEVDGEIVDDAAVVRAHRRMTARVGCTYFQWLSVIDDGGVRQRPVRREPFASGCRRGPSAEERRLLKILESADRFAAPDRSERRIESTRGVVRLVR